MKKLVLIMTILLSLASLTACRKNVTAKFPEDLDWDAALGQYKNEEGAELVLWHDNEEFSETIIALWEKEYPEIPLSYELNPTADNAEKLKLDGPAGLGGDVFYMPHDVLVDLWEAGGLFMLPDRTKEQIMATMQESSYKVAMYEGELYALPSSVENIALVYNKQMIQVLPAIPTMMDTDAANLLEQIENQEIYFEELLEGIAAWGNSFSGAGVEVLYMSERFSDAKDRHSIMAWELYNAYHNYPLLTRNGYRVFGPANDDPTQFNITAESVTESIRSITGSWYGNIDHSPLFPGLADIEDLAWDQGPAKLQKGQLAITITGPWVMTDIKENWELWVEEGTYGVTADTDRGEIFSAVALPKFNNGQAPVTFSGVQVIGMNIYTEYPNATMNLMNFLMSEPVVQATYQVLGKIPALKDSSVIPGLKEDLISQGFLAQAEFSHPMPALQEVNYMWDPLRDVWTNVFNEKMTIEAAQKQSQKEYDRILADSGK